jgi:hypothetical protein
MTPKVSSVLCTFGRFETVRRSVAMWLAQDYEGPKELIIFSTSPVPLVLGETLAKMPNVILVNAPTREDGTPWESLGQVRNAALKHCTGFLYSCWDDDDLFLPWHLSQSVDHWARCGAKIWKPEKSLFSMDGGKSFKLAGNAMEASILAELDFVHKFGFSEKQSGAEHVQGGWLDKAREKGELFIESVSPFESYGYVWGDGLHKTSGSIDNPDNFENHQDASNDFGDGQPLEPVTLDELKERFAAAFEWALATT